MTILYEKAKKKRCGHSPAHHCSTQNQSTLRHKNDTTPQSAKAMPLLFTLQVWLATWFNAARTSREFDQQPVGPCNSATLRICKQVPAAYKGISCNRCILLFYHRMTSTAHVFTAGKPPKSWSMGELSHGTRTVQCFWNIHPASTPLNSPHRTTPKVPIFAPCSPYWHTGNFFFCSDACHRSQGPNFYTLQLLLVYQN